MTHYSSEDVFLSNFTFLEDFPFQFFYGEVLFSLTEVRAQPDLNFILRPSERLKSFGIMGNLGILLKSLSIKASLLLDTCLESVNWLGVAITGWNGSCWFAGRNFCRGITNSWERWEKFSNKNDTLRRVLEILVNWHISTQVFWRRYLELSSSKHPCWNVSLYHDRDGWPQSVNSVAEFFSGSEIWFRVLGGL